MTEQNTAATSELLQQATAGDAKAQFELALCYINGKGVDKSQALALEWHEKSAEQGYVEAQFALGLYYFWGVDDTQTRKLLSKWVNGLLKNNITSALNLSVSQAMIDNFQKGNSKFSFKWFKQAAEQNHAESCYWLGMCYQNGWGTESNVELAFSNFKQSAELNYADAYSVLAHCYRDATGTEKNYNRAFHWITKAVEKNDIDPEDCLFLGDLYSNGYGTHKNDNLAFKWYEKVAKMADDSDAYGKEIIAQAQNHLAHCYENGEGVEKSLELASQYYRKAHVQGLVNTGFQFRMANYYLYGKGVEQDYVTGMKWMIAAIQAGHIEADQFLIDAFLALIVPTTLLGKGKDNQYYKYIFDRCIQEINGHNEPEAYFFLGILYYSGKGVEQNDVRAFKSFEQSRDAYTSPKRTDHIFSEDDLLYQAAEFYVAICYALGKGVKKDLDKSRFDVTNGLCQAVVEGISAIHDEGQHVMPFLILLGVDLFKLSKEYDLAREFINEALEESDGID